MSSDTEKNSVETQNQIHNHFIPTVNDIYNTYAPDNLDEEPLYVNAKQYNRILKRRQVRARIEAAIKKQKENKKNYQYYSRHKHAMNRPRGPGGRFLTAAELELLKKATDQPADTKGK